MENPNNQRIEALEAQVNERMQALAEENLRLKRSARRYARWSTIFVAVACVGALSYAWAIDPLTDTGSTAPAAAGEVKTEFADAAVISAEEFSSNFENLTAKVNELVPEVNANTALETRHGFAIGSGGTTMSGPSSPTILTEVTLPAGDWQCHYSLQVSNSGGDNTNDMDVSTVLSTSAAGSGGDILMSTDRGHVDGALLTSAGENLGLHGFAVLSGVGVGTKVYLKGADHLGGTAYLTTASLLCTELIRGRDAF